MKQQSRELAQQEKGFCATIGLVGVGIAATTLIQLFEALLVLNALTIVMIFTYILAIISYSLFALKKYFAPYLMLASTVLMLCMLVLYSLMLAFSVLLVLLFLYCLVTTIVVLINEYPKKLKQHLFYLKQDDDYWENRI